MQGGNIAKTPHTDIVRRADAIGADAPWYRLLGVAIICRAVLDMKKLLEDDVHAEYINGSLTSRSEIREFAESGWCEVLMSGVANWTPEYIERVATRKCVTG